MPNERVIATLGTTPDSAKLAQEEVAAEAETPGRVTSNRMKRDPETAQVEVGEAQLYQDGGNQWRFRVRGKNHQTIASGEGYENKADAKAACQALLPDGVKIVELKGGKPVIPD